jgi:GTP-binding protein
VSAAPGKTRLLNVYELDERLYLVDFPGYGYARVSRTERRSWRARLERYLATRETLAGVVWLLDIRRDPSPDDLKIRALIARTGRPLLAVLTKCDKLAKARRVERRRAITEVVELTDDQIVTTSARTGEGIAELTGAVEHLQ